MQKNKQAQVWLRKLKKELFFLEKNDKKELINYYYEQIQERILQKETIDDILSQLKIDEIAEEIINNLPYEQKQNILKNKNKIQNKINFLISWPFVMLLFLAPIICFVVFGAMLALPPGLFIFSFLSYIAYDASRATAFMFGCWFGAIVCFFVFYSLIALLWKYCLKYFVKYTVHFFDPKEKTVAKIEDFSFFALFQKINKVWWIVILVTSTLIGVLGITSSFVGEYSVFGGLIQQKYIHTENDYDVLEKDMTIDNVSISDYDQIYIDISNLSIQEFQIINDPGHQDYSLNITRYHRMKATDDVSYVFSIETIDDVNNTLTLTINEIQPWYDIVFGQSQKFTFECGTHINIL
ncbi:HAAS signaling domain-containing protein [Spiroplasma endosymbiont of Amphibalanus improvisus]|uniref:HAAS signaling domain-containing protein n=1 Tax=Spiroplasma endosymbiont of Amphibalanus improvisus TaxID=3066327 RepID=UPI00313D2A6A